MEVFDWCTWNITSTRDFQNKGFVETEISSQTASKSNLKNGSSSPLASANQAPSCPSSFCFWNPLSPYQRNLLEDCDPSPPESLEATPPGRSPLTTNQHEQPTYTMNHNGQSNHLIVWIYLMPLDTTCKNHQTADSIDWNWSWVKSSNYL